VKLLAYCAPMICIVNSRLRFMLRDLIELREHNWVPRRDEEKAKTIAQIHEQVAREEVLRETCEALLCAALLALFSLLWVFKQRR
jgi:hypothetical protein